MIAISSFRRVCIVLAMVFSAQQVSWAAVPTFLVNPGVYAGTASSEFLDLPLYFPVGNLFDTDNETTWAIQGYLGGNSQGREEGWVSVTLDQTYLISDLRFAARKPSGSTDGIDTANFWVSASPFSVNVTNATSTNAFLATAEGQTPDLSLGPFASFADIDYSFGTIHAGKYLLAQFVNTTDGNSNRNLGARTLQVGVVGVVPEPTTAALGLSALCLAVSMRRGPWQ